MVLGEPGNAAYLASMSGPSFASWMQEVDRELTKLCGLGVNDLADYRYADAFNDELDPAEVAEDVLAENDFPF